MSYTRCAISVMTLRILHIFRQRKWPITCFNSVSCKRAAYCVTHCASLNVCEKKKTKKQNKTKNNGYLLIGLVICVEELGFPIYLAFLWLRAFSCINLVSQTFGFVYNLIIKTRIMFLTVFLQPLWVEAWVALYLFTILLTNTKYTGSLHIAYRYGKVRLAKCSASEAVAVCDKHGSM